MAEQTDIFGRFFSPADMLSDMLRASRAVFVKKLSVNDRSWANDLSKHQGGFYVFARERDSGFFPCLNERRKTRGGDKPVREVFFDTHWPQFGVTRQSRLVHYTSKGSETHLTGVPKAAFSDLAPASWIVMAPCGDGSDAGFNCLTIDSSSDEADLLVDMLQLDADFDSGIISPAEVVASERDRVLDFADELAAAWLAGEIAGFAGQFAALPSTDELARMAQAKFLNDRGIGNLNPFRMEKPGDALFEISRVIEWEMFQDFERRQRAVALIRLVMGDTPTPMLPKDFIKRLINSAGLIDGLMLSIGQRRKSRAGYSFEHHIAAMLLAGAVPFEKQAVIDARKRPDFVLPSLQHLDRVTSGPGKGLILSAKTTLRERWKQVQREKGTRDLYLATVDDSIATNAIEDMASLGIFLVVPEKLKASTITEYKKQGNVLDFKTFFSDEIQKERMPAWPSDPVQKLI